MKIQSRLMFPVLAAAALFATAAPAHAADLIDCE